jgi:hypothetical protein
MIPPSRGATRLNNVLIQVPSVDLIREDLLRTHTVHFGEAYKIDFDGGGGERDLERERVRERETETEESESEKSKRQDDIRWTEIECMRER